MDERFDIAGVGPRASPGLSSEWMEIWKRPYNSGLAVYRSLDGGTYYLRFSRSLSRFDSSSGISTTSCSSDNIPPYTAFGEQISGLKKREEREVLDPGAPYLSGYIEADQRGTIPTSPPKSKYYLDLEYLGKFGLLRAEGRGNEVGFAPADKVPEPRLGLNVSCG